MAFTVVICAGAMPLYEMHEPLVRAFEAHHHPAICDIPSYAKYDPSSPSTINPDSIHLREHVLQPLLEEGRDVVIFMHSYGGVYGAESLEGISKRERKANGVSGGVIAVIFFTACVAPKGTTALAAMGMDPENPPELVEFDGASGLIGFKKDQAKTLLYHDLPDEEAERLATMLPKQPYACFIMPSHWDPFHDSYYQGKLGYIFAEADRIFPLETQRNLAKLGGIEKTYLLEGASHSAHIEQPEKLAKVALELVERMVKDGEA